jgi:hypothetical protein
MYIKRFQNSVDFLFSVEAEKAQSVQRLAARLTTEKP